MTLHLRFAVAALALASSPVAARDSLGMFAGWGAFRDSAVPRCYAISRAERASHDSSRQAYADVASWPRHGIHSQLHLHLSRAVAPGSKLVLAIGSQHFTFVGNAADAWLADQRLNATAVGMMRVAPAMRIVARDVARRRFTDSWQLAGAASASDAATIGCARPR